MGHLGHRGPHAEVTLFFPCHQPLDGSSPLPWAGRTGPRRALSEPFAISSKILRESKWPRYARILRWLRRV